MALRAGYFGLKRFEKNKLLNLIASTPADIGPDNPIAGKNDVLASIDLIDKTVGWIGKNLWNLNLWKTVGLANATAVWSDTGVSITATGSSGRTVISNFPENLPIPVKAGEKLIVSWDGEFSGKGRVDISKYGDFDNLSYYKSVPDTDKKIEYTVIEDMTVIIRVLVLNSGDTVTFNNIMVCTAKQYDLSPVYEPYHASVAELLDSKMSIGRILASSDDLNDVTATGIYTISTSPVNAPESVAYATLIVKYFTDGDVTQLIYKNDAIYSRKLGGSPASWGSWYKFTGTTVQANREDETKKAAKKKVIKEEEE